LFPPKEEISFEHFNVDRDSKKVVKRVIDNNTTVKIKHIFWHRSKHKNIYSKIYKQNYIVHHPPTTSFIHINIYNKTYIIKQGSSWSNYIFGASLEQPWPPPFIHSTTMSLVVSFGLFVSSSFLIAASFFLVPPSWSSPHPPSFS
jgi:hypothetical protein